MYGDRGDGFTNTEVGVNGVRSMFRGWDTSNNSYKSGTPSRKNSEDKEVGSKWVDSSYGGGARKERELNMRGTPMTSAEVFTGNVGPRKV